MKKEIIDTKHSGLVEWSDGSSKLQELEFFISHKNKEPSFSYPATYRLHEFWATIYIGGILYFHKREFFSKESFLTRKIHLDLEKTRANWF